MTDIQSPGLQQITPGTPGSSALATVTQPLLVPVQTDQRFRSFPPQTYNLSPHSNLVRFLRVLLGDAGAGQLRKRLVMNRLGQVMTGAYFYDLDAFYGSIFGIKRATAELLSVDPYTTTAPQSTWREQAKADASYKQRLFQFGRAIEYGPSPIGMKLIAEAILNITCDIYESFRYADQQAMTYGGMESYTYSQLQNFTYAQLEGMTGETPNSLIRKQFIISPHRPITPVEAYAVMQVIEQLKPADALYEVISQGPDVYQVVPISGVWADSLYWEIQQNVTVTNTGANTPYGTAATGDVIQPSVPPFNAFQGEQWFYNKDIVGSISYAQDQTQKVILSPDIQRIVWADDTYTDFLPTNAALPWWQAILGRYAQDGVMAINPVAGRGGLNSPVTLSDLTFDGIPVGELLSTLGSQTVSNLQKSSESLSFWSTQPRAQTDLTREILEIRFGGFHSFNAISFEVARFPQHISLEYYDDASGQWYSVMARDILDSIPAVLGGSQDYLLNKTHPQHYGTGHWENITAKVAPFVARRIRIVLTRGPGDGPVQKTLTMEPSGTGWMSVTTDVPYSLGVRKLKMGFSIESDNDLPIPYLPNDTVIGSATDILGSPVDYVLYREDPSGPIADTPSQWRSAPQPINNAVVNFYLDVRDHNGKAQAVDRFFIDPTHLGVHATLYYSNDTPTASDNHAAQDTPLVYPASQITGTVYDSAQGLQFPTAGGTIGYVTVENWALQWDPAEDWWVGLSFRAGLAPTSGVLPLLDLRGTRISYSNGAFVIQPADGSNPLVSYVPLPAGVVINLVVGHSKSGGWEMSYQIGANTPVTAVVTEFTTGYSQSSSRAAIASGSGAGGSSLNATSTSSAFAAATTAESFPTIMLGGFNDASVPATSGMLLFNLVLKSETLTSSTINGFMGNPSLYCVKGSFTGQDQGFTTNAYLRFDPSFISTENPTGLVGGQPTFYPDLYWTPVPGDFILTKGYLTIPPTLAKFWKFEMTNLAPEPFEGFLPIQRSVQTFPSSVLSDSVSDSTPGYQGAMDPGIATLGVLAQGNSPYPNSGVQPTPPPTTASSLQISPTQVMVATDPSTAAQIGQASWLYNFADYHQGQRAPRFNAPGYHSYQNSDVAYAAKVAYFCGFNQIQACRTSVLAQNDSEVYYEFFLDDLHIATNTFEQDPGELFTSANPSLAATLPNVAQSVSYLSTHDVVGLQFATTQSDAVQVVYDDDMRNQALNSASWVDNTTWHVTGDVSPNKVSYNAATNSIVFSRSTAAPPASQTSSGAVHGMVNPPIEPVLDVDIISTAGGSTSGYGGLESAELLLSARGRAWIATRYTPLTDLTSPLFVQLFDTVANRVIWEAQTSGPKGSVTEFYASYDIGSVPNTVPTSALRVRIVQKGASNDIVSVDTLSVFDESIVWEFSVDGGSTFWQAIDTRNNPNGVVTFPTPSQQLVWRVTCYRQEMHITGLQIRPIYESQLNVDAQPFMRGPNVSFFDMTPDVYHDPMFNQWNNPVPRWWFIAFKQYPNLFPDGVPIVSPFSQFFNRVTDDDISGLTDSVTRLITKEPSAFEFLPAITDSVAWTNGSFTRSPAENLSTTFGDAASGEVIHPAQYPNIIEPLMEPPIT